MLNDKFSLPTKSSKFNIVVTSQHLKKKIVTASCTTFLETKSSDDSNNALQIVIGNFRFRYRFRSITSYKEKFLYFEIILLEVVLSSTTYYVTCLEIGILKQYNFEILNPFFSL
jgi:hypothetical protein